MTKVPPAPEAIIQLVKGGCSKQRCSTNRCQCRKAGLTCVGYCSCFDADEICKNVLDQNLSGCEGDSDDNDAVDDEKIDTHM